MKKSNRLNPAEISKRRSKYEIWVSILELCYEIPLHQTMIFRKLRLTTQKGKNSLGFLLEQNLLTQIKDDEGKWFQYQTTEKGIKALNEFNELILNFFTSNS